MKSPPGMRQPSCPWWSHTNLLARASEHARIHVFDNGVGELTGLDFGRAFHQALEIISHSFLFDGALKTAFNQVRSLGPSHETEHHYAGKNHRTGVDDILVGVFRRSAMGCFEARETVSNIGPWRDAEPADLRRAGIGNVVAVQIGRRQDGILVGASDNLLKD